MQGAVIRLILYNDCAEQLVCSAVTKKHSFDDLTNWTMYLGKITIAYSTYRVLLGRPSPVQYGLAGVYLINFCKESASYPALQLYTYFFYDYIYTKFSSDNLTFQEIVGSYIVGN